MFTLLLSATRIIWLKRFRSAFRAIFWPFVRDVFVLIVENVFSLCSVVLPWNFTDGGSSSDLVHLNVCYASSPTSNARRPLTTADGATVTVDRITRSDSSGDNGFSQLFSSRSIRIRDLMYGMLHTSFSLDPTYKDEEVWKYLGLSCPSSFSDTLPYTRRLSSTDLLTASGFKLNPLVPLASTCPCSPFIDRLVDRDSSEGVVGAKLT